MGTMSLLDGVWVQFDSHEGLVAGWRRSYTMPRAASITICDSVVALSPSPDTAGHRVRTSRLLKTRQLCGTSSRLLSAFAHTPPSTIRRKQPSLMSEGKGFVYELGHEYPERVPGRGFATSVHLVLPKQES